MLLKLGMRSILRILNCMERSQCSILGRVPCNFRHVGVLKFLLKLTAESFSLIGTGRLFQNLGTATANARSPNLAPGARNLEKTQWSSIPGSWLEKNPADTLAPCPWELWTQEGLSVRREIAQAFVAQTFNTLLVHHSVAWTEVATRETDATNKPSNTMYTIYWIQTDLSTYWQHSFCVTI